MKLTAPAGTFAQVSLGFYHACALKPDGTVACWFPDDWTLWGNPAADDNGQATPPAGSFTQLSAGGFHTCAVRSDGTVACWGRNTDGQASPPAGTFTQISAGYTHTCGLQAGGTIVCWGSNSNGQSTPAAGVFTRVTAGGTHTCGLRSDGSVACWGSNIFGQSVPPAGTFTQVSAGFNRTCGLTPPGSLACWGNGVSTHPPPSTGTYTQISTGFRQTCALELDHSVACWGDLSIAESPRPPRIISFERAGGASDPILLASGGANAFMVLTFVAPNGTQPFSASIDCGNGTTLSPSGISSPYAATCSYTDPGVYTLHATVSNIVGTSAVATYQFVVVYDPSGGFVTGGGWIDSPAGAYTADPSLTGKATFGLVSKYHNGATTPSGNTEFQFKEGNLRFAASTFDWMVVSGARARLRGRGTINGAGDYAFLLSAIDGQVNGGGGVDRFRIKIWNRATSQVVYDNQLGADEDSPPTTAIGGGSIVIHK